MTRILLVDDDALLRSAIHTVLAAAGYEVIEAGDGGSGLLVEAVRAPRAARRGA